MSWTYFPLIILLGLAGGCSNIADRVLVPRRDPARIARFQKDRLDVQERLGDRFKTLSGESFDGTKLSAIILEPETSPRGIILCLHGLSDSKEAMLSVAEPFAAAGYVAVCADLRGHGESGARYMTLGYHEKHDLAALLDRLTAMGYDTSSVGVLGGSLGAATALQFAGVDSRVKAVIAVAPFSTLRGELTHLYGVAQTAPMTRWLAETSSQRQAKFRIDDVSPLAAVKSISTPIYLAHGRFDNVIPPEHSYQLFNVAAGPVVLEVVDARHTDIGVVLGGDFMKRAVEWMDAWIAPAEEHTAPEWVAAFPSRNFGADVRVATSAK